MEPWLPKVHDYLLETANVPHEWGKSDCLCKVDDCVAIKTGQRYMAPFRGKYSSYEEALKLVRKKGFDEPVDMIASIFSEIEPRDAMDCDIAAIEGVDGTLAFGIFMRDKIIVQSERALGKHPRSMALRAFKVP